MTIEQLIGMSADQLEKMTDAERLEHFGPMLDITRPDRAAKTVIKQEQKLQKTDPKLAQGLELLKKLGVDGASSALLGYKNKRK